jgi:fucose 4-O-acetylase-like acetyltransferase
MIATVFCLPSNEVSMYMGSYGNIPIFIVRAFSFSFFFVYLSLLLTHTTHIKQILLFIGQNTLGIMVIHKPIVHFFRDFVIQNGFSSSSIIVALAISFLGVAISLVINQILRLTVPVLIGRDEVKMIQKRTKQ